MSAKGRAGQQAESMRGMCSVHAGSEVQLCMDLLDFCKITTSRKWEGGGTSDRFRRMRLMSSKICYASGYSAAEQLPLDLQL